MIFQADGPPSACLYDINLNYIFIFAFMKSNREETPGYLSSMFALKCPRCRRGDMFVHRNPFKRLRLKYILDMPRNCAECGQKFEIETGFWYGTGYVSYALTVALSVATFVAWWVLIGFSLEDNRLFYWLILNGVLLMALQPYLMRLSRTMYLFFFVKYNPHYKSQEPTRLT